MKKTHALRLWRGTRRERQGFIALVGLAVGAVAAVMMLLLVRAPYSPSPWRGYQVASQEGCFVCHGPSGQGGVANPKSIEGTIPPFVADATFTFYVRSAAEIREWIMYGRPVHRGTNERFRQGGVIEMPAYEGKLDEAELDDLVAYLSTVAELDQPCDPEAVRGRKVAADYACFGCHGPSGSGGYANPGSFKHSIPPWNSEDFNEVVKNDQELRQWILTGGIERFRSNPAARFFLDRQVIKMPGYDGKISDDDLDALIKYIKWVRQPAAADVCPKEWVARRDENSESTKQDLTALGAAEYRQRGCATCHGAQGEGGVRNTNHRVEKVPALHNLALKLGLYSATEASTALKWLTLGAPDTKNVLSGLTDAPMFRENFAREMEIVISGAESQRRSSRGPKPPMDMPAWSHTRGSIFSSDPRTDIRAIFAYLITLQDWRDAE